MNLPEQTASTAELTAFANSLSDDRRLRLAAALLAPTAHNFVERIDEDHEDADDLDGAVNTLAAALTEFNVDDVDFNALADLVYDLLPLFTPRDV